MKNTLSIIICSKDRPKLLANVAKNLLEQSVFPDRLVIIDNSKLKENVTEGKTVVTKIIGKKIPLDYFYDDSGLGLPNARNIGKKRVNTDIVLFLDDDVLLEKDYTEKLLEFYEKHPEAGAACGNLKQPQEGRFSSFLRIVLGTVFLFDSFKPFQVLPSGWGSHPFQAKTTDKVTWLSGCNMSYRRKVLEEFHSDVNVPSQGGGEDRDLSYRVSKKYPMYVITECKGIHEMIKTSRPSLGETNKRAVYGNAYFYKKNVTKSLFTDLAFGWSTIGYLIKTTVQILLSSQEHKIKQIRILFSSLSMIKEIDKV